MGDVHLLAWLLIGLGLRLLNLAGKSAWSDEWATMVFSLGHSFQSVPLDQPLSLDQLLAVARLDGAGPAQVVQHLMNESTHPPLYFLLSHLWIRLWQPLGALVDLGVARSLSSLFGWLCIPAFYRFTQEITGSRPIARTAAALMAVSPFGVYLAQEARHYTLALLFCLVSMGCFVQAWQAIARSSCQSTSPNSPSPNSPSPPVPPALPLKTVALWVTANLLGLATHYFVGLLLLAQATALVGQLLWQWLRTQRLNPTWQSLATAMGLTLLGALPWGVFWLRIPGDRLTAWVSHDLAQEGFSWSWLLAPLGRLGAALGSMVLVPAVEQVPHWGAIASILLLLPLLAGLFLALVQGFRRQWVVRSPVFFALWSLLLAELGWILLVTYGFQRDLTLGARYVFSLLPVVLVIVAMVLHRLPPSPWIRPWLLAAGLAGSLFVAAGYAYAKPDQARELVAAIQTIEQGTEQATEQITAQQPAIPGAIVLGAVYKTHEQVSEVLSLAYEWQRHPPDNPDLPEPLIILAQRDPLYRLTTHAFVPALTPLPRPAALWLINFAANLDFAAIACDPTPTHKLKVSGYSAKRYTCPGAAPVASPVSSIPSAADPLT